MSLGKKEFAIATIIKKELFNEKLSEEEAAFLQEWLLLAENQEQYNRIIDFETLKSKEHFYTTIDATAAYNRIIKKIDKKNVSVIPLYNYRRLLKYAAIILALLSIAIPFYKGKTESTKEITNVVTSLLPRYNNPTLILADGTVVSLEPKKDTIVSKNGIITNVNQVLAYNTKTSKGISSNAENTLIVPVGGIYAVTLSDGTKVWLNSKSTLKYPVNFSGDKRTVTLDGEAYFEVTKNTHSPFSVKTKSGNVNVLGTHFNVSSYSDDEIFSTTLVEGKVEVSDFDNSSKKSSVILRPNQQVNINAVTISPKVIEVDTELYTAWKEGKFYFENESLKEILKKMARWYNFNLHFEEKSLEKIKFTGSVLKDEPLEDLLEVIGKSSGVKYKITKKNQTYDVILRK